MNHINQKYPLVWEKDNLFIKIFCSIPNISTGIVITSKESIIVVDPGDGILRDLNQDLGQAKILEISDIFISHGHHDHVGGIWSLLTYLSVMKRTKPLNIYFPANCEEVITIQNAFKKVYSHEIKFNINLIPIDNEKEIELDDIKVISFKVNHKEQSSGNEISVSVPALGFKFFNGNKSICYGGDTAYCDNLVEMVKNSDLAIIEAGSEEKDNLEMHLSIDEAIEIGKTAKEYFLVHMPQK
ncbi:MAG: ribonuclease Z [Melioribacteraceae bacterium]|nr:ribonuclease Z [Melioribacteraceae bacterium]